MVHLPVSLLETSLLDGSDLRGVNQVGALVNLELSNDVLEMAGAASSGGATTLSLEGPLVVTDAGRVSKTARGAGGLLVVEGARSAASADSVGLNVLSTTKAGGTLRLQGGQNRQENNNTVSTLPKGFLPQTH